MKDMIITEIRLRSFSDHLLREEKSAATHEKYLRDLREFMTFAAGW